MSNQQWAFLTAVLVAVLTSTALGWLKEYFGTKGKNLATKQDFADLKKQLQENTEITKAIERTYARDDFLWRSELAYRERQLSELYGPAYGYIKSQNEIYDLWMEGKMQPVNLEVKKILKEQNRILRDLLIHKAHLIEGPAMPDSFVRFFTSTLVFDLFAAPTGDGMVPEHLRSDARTIYPNAFNEHILGTTEQLKIRIESLNAKYAPSLPAR